ncbi:hypothetical protein HOB30_01765 [Candidatus Falkowbacteria bacterium]|nr:hypothetical protein [Candidatus Falkowbacteria bacterium]
MVKKHWKTDLIYTTILKKLGLEKFFSISELRELIDRRGIGDNYLYPVLSRFVAEGFIVKDDSSRPHQYKIIAHRKSVAERAESKSNYLKLVRSVLNQGVGHEFTVEEVRLKLDGRVPISTLSDYLYRLTKEGKLSRRRGYNRKYVYFVNALIEVKDVPSIAADIWELISTWELKKWRPQDVYYELMNRPNYIEHSNLKASVSTVIRRWKNNQTLILLKRGIYTLAEGVKKQPSTTDRIPNVA